MSGTTTNYGWTYPTSTDYVKDGATAIQTLATGIDTSLNSALGTKPAGMVLLNTTNVTSAATTIISTVFNSTYEKYLVTWQLLTTTRDALYCRFAAGGSQLNGASSYRSSWSYVGYSGATGSYDNMVIVPSVPGSGSGAVDYYGELWVHSPTDTSRFTMFNQNSGGSFATTYDHSAFYGGGVYQATTAIDGIAFSIPTGNLTGKIRIYGVKNS